MNRDNKTLAKFFLSTSEMVDHYHIIRPIGKGGMGEVYVARDTLLGRKVALKIIRSEKLKDMDLESFYFEAKVTARFNHPNIVTIYGVGEYKGFPYIALEYLEGETWDTGSMVHKKWEYGRLFELLYTLWMH